MEEFTIIIVKNGKVYSTTRKITHVALEVPGTTTLVDMAKDGAEFIMKEILEKESQS